MGLQAEWPKAKQNSETCIHTGLPRFFNCCMVFYWFDIPWFIHFCSINRYSFLIYCCFKQYFINIFIYLWACVKIFLQFVLKESFHYQICSYFSSCWRVWDPHILSYLKRRFKVTIVMNYGKQRRGCSGKINEWKMKLLQINKWIKITWENSNKTKHLNQQPCSISEYQRHIDIRKLKKARIDR